MSVLYVRNTYMFNTANANGGNTMNAHPVKSDSRYTVRKEYCGHAEPRFVARFCGEWIGQSKFYTSAVALCVGHKARMNGALVIEEKRA